MEKVFIKNSLNNKIEVFTYISLRVGGNESFAQYTTDVKYLITHYTNMNDILPHLSPRSKSHDHVVVKTYGCRSLLGRTEFVYCDQSFDEGSNCGQSQQRPYSLLRHILVFNKSLVLPCC